MVEQSLQSKLFQNLKTNLEAAFLAEGIVIDLSVYSEVDPITDEYQGTLDVQARGVNVDATDYLPIDYTVTIVIVHQKANGFEAFNAIADVHEFLLNYLYQTLATEGLAIDNGKYFLGVDPGQAQCQTKLGQDNLAIARSLNQFTWRNQ